MENANQSIVIIQQQEAYDGPGYDWAVSYDYGDTFVDVDYTAWQEIVDDSTATGLDPFGNPVTLGTQNTTVVGTNTGADAVVTLGQVGTTASTTYSTLTPSRVEQPVGDKTFDPDSDVTLDTSYYVRLGPTTGTMFNSIEEYGTFVNDLRTEAINERINAVNSLRNDAITITTDYQSGTTNERISGPGITMFAGGSIALDDYNVGEGTSFSDTIQNRAAAAEDANLPPGLTNPLDFSAVRLNDGTFVFATEEDAEAYGTAYLERTLQVLGLTQETQTRISLAQDLIFGIIKQNPEEFLVRHREAMSGENDYFELTTGATGIANILLQRPEVIESIRTQLNSGVDSANLDLRLNSVTTLSDSEMDAYLLFRQAGGADDPEEDVFGGGGDLVSNTQGYGSVQQTDYALIDTPVNTDGGFTGVDQTTTIPNANLDNVLIGNDTPPAPVSPGTNLVEARGPATVTSSVFVTTYNPTTGGYNVVDSVTGQVVARNLTRAQAMQEAEKDNQSASATQTRDLLALAVIESSARPLRQAAAQLPPSSLTTSTASTVIGSGRLINATSAVSVAAAALTYSSGEDTATSGSNGFTILDTALDQDIFADPNLQLTLRDDFTDVNNTGDTVTDDPYSVENDPYADLVENEIPENVDPDENPQVDYRGTPYDDDGNLNPGWAINTETGDTYYVGPDYIDPSILLLAQQNRQDFFNATLDQAARNRARQQAVIEAQRKQANEGDWRVKLRLAGGSQYLYNEPGISSDGILYPLKVTDGVIFPYMPQMNTVYGANYSAYDLTHSNLRGYFYQNSYVDEITMTSTFTAQDTSEANYLLAVIHFFRSVTKMFYGQDGDRGQPPPLVFLQGLGAYQFNLHPCVVRSFTYNLPNDIDYIRARSVNIDGTNLLARRDRQTLAGGFDFLSSVRMATSGLSPGGLVPPPSPPTLGTSQPTYVPTKLEISLTLLPIQSREQVSQQFSLRQFANGDLIKAGFW